MELAIFALADRNSVAEIEHYSGSEVDGNYFLERASDSGESAAVPVGFGAH